MFGNDQEVKAWSVEFIGKAGLHIMGSRTFAGMAALWPTSSDQFAAPMNRIPKAVFSKGEAIRGIAGVEEAGNGQSPKPQSGAESWAHAYVGGGDLGEEIAKLKARGGEADHRPWRCDIRPQPRRPGLDRPVRLLVVPAAIGRGSALFSELAAPMRLKLVSSEPFPGGAAAQIYRPA